MMKSNPDHILSVTDLNRRARQLLEIQFSMVWVRGEISNLSTPSSGHSYFTLKDNKAQIRCAMFKGNNSLLRFKPEHGMQIIARGRVSLYEGRGDYQLIIENMSVDGAGNLQIAFEQLKQKLADERLFDEEFKQALPAFPQHIGVITSPTGAVIRDILSVLKRRFPAIRVSIFPVPVQGEYAAPAIVHALALANQQADIDTLILARGGGSLEDLWAFNEEAVVRAVFASEIPVVSAVGHETDFTLCDFVADVRAPTPSVAAEMLSPDQADIATLLADYLRQLTSFAQRSIAAQRLHLLHLTKRLRHPKHALREQQQKLDHLEWRFRQALIKNQQNPARRLEKLQTKLQPFNPLQQIQTLRLRVARAHDDLLKNTLQNLHAQRQRLQYLVALLDGISPLNTLKRGYAIVQDEQHNTLTNASTTTVGAHVYVRLFNGQLACVVKTIEA